MSSMSQGQRFWNTPLPVSSKEEHLTTETVMAKKPRTRKGVSDKTLYKHIKLAQKRFNLDDESSIDSLLVGLRDAVMEDILD